MKKGLFLTLASAIAIDSPTPEWQKTLQALEDADWQVRRDALGSLDDTIPTERAISALILALADEHPEVRDAAISALVNIGPEAASALVQAIADNSQACGASPPTQTDPETIDKLVKEMEDQNEQVRQAAVEALVAIGPQAAPATIQALGGSCEMRNTGAWALTRIGADAVPHLIPALADEDLGIRQGTLWALQWMGPEAVEAVPALFQALQDADPDVRQAAAHGLGNAGEEAADALPALVQVAGDPDPEVRLEAVRALGLVGPAQGQVAALIQALPDRDESVRQAAVEGLGEIGPEAAEALPPLVQVLESGPSPDVRSSAALALGKIQIDAATPQVLAPLIQALRDSSRHVRRTAASALSLIGPGAREAVPALIQGLEDRMWAVREAAAAALKAITGQDLDPADWAAWWEEQQ